MESSLSCLSSLKDDDRPVYVQPHYKEAYRLAIYALLCGGKDAYEEFLRAEQISHLLSEEEILFVLGNAELPVWEDDCDGKRVKDAAAPSTYFPTESDEEVPDLELGWPEVPLEGTDTSISLLFHPPRQDTPSIKEVVRKQIQGASQVIAIAMDVFTDIDIFTEVVSATLRGVSIYILLDDAHFSSFITMTHRVGLHIQDLKNVRIRTVQGQEYRCRSGVKFHGDMQQKFILIDCQTVIYGTYSYTWSYEKINLSMVLVVTGQLVSSYDEEFRRLYASSTVPVVLSRERFSVPDPRQSMALKSPNSSQLSLQQIHLKSRGMRGMRGAQDDRFNTHSLMTRGLSMQERLHQSHWADIGNLVRGQSYGGELQKLSSMTRLRMGNKDPGVPVSPERSGPNQRVGELLLPNRLSQHHSRHRTRYGADQNLIPFNSETSLHKWKMDTYLNDGDVLPDVCDPMSPMTSPYNSHTGLNENQSQLIHSMSRDIKSRMEEMRQKRLSLQEYTNFRQSQEFLRSMCQKERPTFMSARGLDVSGGDLEPNSQNSSIPEPAQHKDGELTKEGLFADANRSASYYDVRMFSDRKPPQAYNWHDPPSRATSAAELDSKLKDPSLKLSHLQSGGLNIPHPRVMESLSEIPEEKEGSNTRVNTSDSALKDGREKIRTDGEAASKENFADSPCHHQARRKDGSTGRPKAAKSSGSSFPGGQMKESVVNDGPTAPKAPGGSPRQAEAKRGHVERVQMQYEQPTFQRKNSLKMRVYSLLSSEEKKASKKEEKAIQKKRAKNPSGLKQPLRADHPQAPPADQAANKYHSPNISRSQNSIGGPEMEMQKSPFSKLSYQKSSKSKTSLSAELDRGSRCTLDDEAVTVYQSEKVYSRYEYLLATENKRGASLSRIEGGYPTYQTQGGADNKLGRFMQRMGSLISKK